MEIGTVSALSIAGMIVSFIISIVLPVCLCIYGCRKMKARLSSFFIGCGIFVVFALILEQILHAVVLTAAGTKLTDNLLLYGLYGGLAAALFEETGRFIAMKFFMKNKLDKKNAWMYGAGHGGIEAILLIGLTYISNIATALMINSSQLDTILGTLDESQRTATIEALSALWTTPGYQFFLGGLERIFAITIQISLSVFVYYGVKNSKKIFIVLAVFLHFLVDFSSVILSDKIPVWGIEIVLCFMAVIIGAIAFKVYNIKETEESENA